MPIAPPGFTVTGTPITNTLGIGGVSGNALTIGGLSLQPSAPGFNLLSSEGGPGFVSGVWQSGLFGTSAARGFGITGNAPGPSGSNDRGGAGGIGGNGFVGSEETQAQGISTTGYLLLGLIAYLLLKGKK
jgi:hypothetical protein